MFASDKLFFDLVRYDVAAVLSKCRYRFSGAGHFCGVGVWPWGGLRAGGLAALELP